MIGDKDEKFIFAAQNRIPMIQRIQSVYLLLAALAAGLYDFLSLGIDETPQPEISVTALDHMPVFAVSSAVGLLALATIFLFRNRNLQMRLCRVNLLLISVLIGLSVFFLFGNPNGNIETPGFGLAMPIFMFVFSFLAMKKIADDEKLVRSMDRLR